MIRQTAIALAILIVIAGALSALVGRQRRRQVEPMRAALLGEIDGGTCAGLGRAQVLSRRLMLADANDQGARAALALAGALLAVDCGQPLTQDVADVAADRGAMPGGADERAVADAAAARVLLRIATGQSGTIVTDAEAAVASAPGTPQPLYALARARARAGDLIGASRALEAAMVAGPSFLPARVAWAEVRLDLGDASTAAEALRALPDPDLRARLLLDEVERARGAAEGRTALTVSRASPAASLDVACDRPQLTYALEVTGCALRDAVRARLAGDRARARASASAAADAAPPDPRLLAQVAQLLAELGAVDRAAALLARADRLAAPEMPAVAWAAFAVALGRGRTPSPPALPAPPPPEGPLLEIRAALAAGGIGALTAAIARVGAGSSDPDRAQLARLAGTGASDPGGAGSTVAGAGAGAQAGSATAAATDRDARRDQPVQPVRAYVDGLRARLAGDLPGAAAQFSRALAGHGDACRAAGEYAAILRALKRKPDARAFAALRAENAGCVNLPR